MKPIIVIALLFIVCTGCEEILFEDDITDKTVVIIAPSEGSNVETTSPSFSWQGLEQTERYRLQIAQPTFEMASQLVEDTLVTGAVFTTQLTKGKYAWRIRGENGASFSPYSTATFTITDAEDFEARDVQLISPKNNFVSRQRTHTLEWQAVTDTQNYRIQLLDTDAQVIKDTVTTETSVPVEFPEAVTTWQVRAETDTQNTLYARRNLTVDATPPLFAQLLTPDDESTINVSPVSFTWSRNNTEDSTEKDSLFVYTDEQRTELVTAVEAVSPQELTLDSGKTYFWLIISYDEAGNRTESETPFQFNLN